MNFFFQTRVRVNSSPSLTFGTTGSFTIDAWIKGHSSPIIGNLSGAPTTYAGYTMSYGNAGTLSFAIGNGASITTLQGPAIAPGAWTFVAVVVDRALQKVTLYTGTPSGGLSTSGPLGIPATADASSTSGYALDIGGCPGNPNGCDTVIDEVEVFKRALPQTELQGILSAGSAGKCPIAQGKKGMTWVQTASNAQTGTITVGCSGCDAHNGDKPCTQQLPLLCIFKPTPAIPLPPGVNNTNNNYKWSGGIVATTAPHVGFTGPGGLAAANAYCSTQLWPGWRVAEFHDGWGWNFQAYGSTVGAPTRFWVYINDQQANCW